MERYRIEVGHEHGVKPGNIVGAIANEAEVDAEYIGRIQINDDHSFVDLPEGMPKEIFKHLRSVWVSGRKLQISRADAAPSRPSAKRPGGQGRKATKAAKGKAPRKRKAKP
jgi:ATP-dependent RNA helicase DeaD